MKQAVISIRGSALDGQELELLLRQLKEYGARNNLNKKQLAAELGVPYSTAKKWLVEDAKATRPLRNGIERIRAFLQTNEAKHRTEIIRGLLLALEDQLRWFRDIEHTHGRDVFRQSLNAFDIGYVTSLLTMISDEEKFGRWLQFSTYNFQEFRSR